MSQPGAAQMGAWTPALRELTVELQPSLSNTIRTMTNVLKA